MNERKHGVAIPVTSQPQPMMPRSRPAPARESKGQSKGRRGRPSQDDYTRVVCAVMRDDPFHLEECTALAQLPGVQAIARKLDRAVFPVGTAIRFLLDRAAHEVEQLAGRQRDQLSLRVAAFLGIWYREQGTVVEVADALGLSRSHVAHHIQKRAMELVARRFLELAWRVDAA